MAGGEFVNPMAVGDYPGKLTRFVLLTYIVAATGGMFFGYDIGISGDVTSMDSFLNKFFLTIFRQEKADTSTNQYCKFDSQLLTSFTSSVPSCAGGVVLRLDDHHHSLKKRHFDGRGSSAAATATVTSLPWASIGKRADGRSVMMLSSPRPDCSTLANMPPTVSLTVTVTFTLVELSCVLVTAAWRCTSQILWWEILLPSGGGRRSQREKKLDLACE